MAPISSITSKGAGGSTGGTASAIQRRLGFQNGREELKRCVQHQQQIHIGL